MSRSFYVGENVKVQDVQAKFENGILTLDIPKKDPKKPVEENHYVTIMEPYHSIPRIFSGECSYRGHF